MKTFKFTAYKSCKLCNGSGYTDYEEDFAGFDSEKMEVYHGTRSEKCPECLDRSICDYQDYCEGDKDGEK